MVKTFAKVALSAAVASLSVTAFGQALEEVVVTAQKRTESLQDVPISVTAISGEQIENASIRSFSELGAYVPNFSVSENAVNTIITMRGISIGANQSFEQSVGMFVDGLVSEEFSSRILLDIFGIFCRQEFFEELLDSSLGENSSSGILLGIGNQHP